MRKLRIVNKERFETFLAIVGLAVMLIVALAIPWRKPTTWEYADFIAEGHTWQEWCEYLEGAEF